MTQNTEQNTEQNVRTRDEQASILMQVICDAGWRPSDAHACVTRELLEAEARGAAEQRRKDAEGQEPVAWVQPSALPSQDYPWYETELHIEQSKTYSLALYTRPANVAALEARIAELERENTTLKKRVINAAETLLSIETPCMEGDNFAVTICSYFEDCEGEPCDNGWHEGATKAYEEIKDAVLQHFRAALTREGGV